MSILKHVLTHIAREVPREIVKLGKEHQVLEKTGDAMSNAFNSITDPYARHKLISDINGVRSNISKNLGLEKCSYCGYKLNRYSKSTATFFNNSSLTICEFCKNKYK